MTIAAFKKHCATTGGPAYPLVLEPAAEQPEREVFPGLSQLDYFAGLALVGMGTWSPPVPNVDEEGMIQNYLWIEQARFRVRAEFAYTQGRAMLAERNKADTP